MIWDVLIAIAIWRWFFHDSEAPDYDKIRKIIKEEIASSSTKEKNAKK